TVDFMIPNNALLSSFVSLKVIADGIASAPTSQVINLGAAQEDVTLRVDPTAVDINGNKLLDVFSGATLLYQRPNNPSAGAINIFGDANNNTVTVDETNGIVNVPVNFD